MGTETYEPYLMKVAMIRDETPDVRTLRLVFADEEQGKKFTFRAGQFGLYSVFGEGECVFCIASPPTEKGYIECSFKHVGKVTTALRRCNEGDTVGFRGPYGNSFPLDEMQGKNLVFVGGGIGFAPVRTILLTCLAERQKYGDITVLNGARSSSDIVYKEETDAWCARTDIHCVKTMDRDDGVPGWTGKIGMIPTVLEEMAPSPDNALCILCGPPIMIKFALMSLDKLGFSKDHVITTMENRMKCGVGKCGRCNIGSKYVCKDGPVFTAAELAELPPDS